MKIELLLIIIGTFFYGCESATKVSSGKDDINLKRNKNTFKDGSYEIYCTNENDEIQGQYTLFYANGNIKEKCNYENDTIVGFCSTYDVDGYVIKLTEGIYSYGNYTTNQFLYFDANQNIDTSKSFFVAIAGKIWDRIEYCSDEDLIIEPVLNGLHIDSVHYDMHLTFEDGKILDTVFMHYGSRYNLSQGLEKYSKPKNIDGIYEIYRTLNGQQVFSVIKKNVVLFCGR